MDVTIDIGRAVSRGMLPLLALHTFTEYYRSDSKPPVTAALIAANTLIYLRPHFLRSIIPPIEQVMFNSHVILKVFFNFNSNLIHSHQFNLITN
jgi:rhomboid domain-containing protein 1